MLKHINKYIIDILMEILSKYYEVDMSNISADLKNKIKNIPMLPGIYKMIDNRGQVIYVGKSKCLKKRVQSYFSKDHKWEKIKRLVSLIHDIDYIVTDTHLEARLLECDLIKTLKPYFNSQMKNDRKYVYLQIKDYNPYNPLAVVNERTDNSYGPFRSKNLLEDLVGLLKNIYPLSFVKNQYVFEYHIFPAAMDKETYCSNKKILKDLFDCEDKMSLFISQLEDKMHDEAMNYRFETASVYRDIINSLKYVKHGINGYKDLFSKRLVLKIPTIDGVKLFYVCKGKILLTKKYKRLPRNEDYIKNFIIKGNAIRKEYSFAEEKIIDKETLDYRDILYSEICSLPEDMIIWQE